MPKAAALAVAAFATLAQACPEETIPLPLGTWGGENAGIVVSDTTMHLHIGCTLGNAPRPVLANGKFEVAGVFNITAHPVDRGIFHPATFTGVVSGNVLVVTVTLRDTAVIVGPARVELGKDPRMGPCPICRPDSRRERV
jgi:hypothetical protein